MVVKKVHKWWEEFRGGLVNFFDFWNTVFVLVSVAVLAGIFVIQLSTSTTEQSYLPIAVAVFTAVYALISFNDMRTEGPANTRTPSVRRDYRADEDSKVYDFGLRNFGPGPALYLRVYARIIPDGADLLIPESESPLHLEEGEFMSLLRRDFAELQNLESDIYDRPDAKEVELYYTWETNGVQCPPGLDSPREMDKDELVEAAEDPRTEKLEDLRKNWLGQSEVA